MNQILKRFALLVLIVAVTACSSSSRDDAAPQVFPFVRLAPSAPPPPQIEYRPGTSAPMMQLWRTGYWTYDGQSFNWVPGHYIDKPDPTADWSPDRWERRTFGWAFVPGHWQ